MVSAVILSYNRCAEVLVTVKRLKERALNFPFSIEIIVVDNGSSDDTSLQVQSFFKDIVLVKKEINAGIAGWNEGFKTASGKYLLVLDDDSCIENGFVGAIDYMENNAEIGILALNIVDQSMKGDPHLKEEEAWKDKANIVGFIGCGAIIRKKLYDTIGGFANWIHVYSHEFEYSIRCLNAGFQIRFYEECNVIHRTSQLNRSFKRTRIYSVRNELAIVYKFFGYNRTKYLFRTLVNNLKFIKREGLTSGIHVLNGAVKFILMRKILTRTPVSNSAQNFYAEHFWSTQPILRSNRKKHESIRQQTLQKNVLNA